MAEFEPAIAVVLEHEGGWSDDPADPGGATKWGVSLRYLSGLENAAGDLDGDGDVDADDVRGMSLEAAREIYRRRWWDAAPFAAIESQAVATKALDLCVNRGMSRGVKLLQEAVRRAGGEVVMDGLFGPNTLAAVNGLPAGWVLTELRSAASASYQRLVAVRPRLRRFLRGWLRRAYD